MADGRGTAAMKRRALLVLLTAVVATVAAGAPASSQRPPRTLLGVLGGKARFDELTGQRTRVGHIIMAWGQGTSEGYFARLFSTMGEMPMLGINTGGTIKPLDIAQGRGDAMLVALNGAIGHFGRPIYIRPFGEMNAHWSDACAFTKSGASKGPAYSTAAFKKAFARLYVILHGGPLPAVNARLKRLGLPPVRGATELAENSYPTLRIVWNPQGYGAPDIPANIAQAYYPGDGYVDVVGDDLYLIRGKAEWAAAEKLYAAHPGKPFIFAEWGLWGIDEPSFVAKMADWVRSHRRTEMISFYNGRPGSIFDIASKPASRAAYRKLVVPLG